MYMQLWMMLIRRKSAAVVFGGVALIVTILFCTFHITGSSWFYVTTQPVLLPWWHTIGATAVGVFFFMCGYAAWLLVPFLWWTAYTVVSHEKQVIEGERFLGWFLCITSSSWLLALLNPQDVMCYGVFGSCFIPICSRAGNIISGTFLFCIQLISLILITQFNFMPLVQKGIRLWGRWAHSFMVYCNTRLTAQLAHGAKWAFIRIMYAIKRGIKFARCILDGSLFIRAGFMTPPSVRPSDRPTRTAQTDQQASSEQLFVFKARTLSKRVEPIKQPEECAQDCKKASAATYKGSNEERSALPDLSFLDDAYQDKQEKFFERNAEQRATILQDKLERFGIKGKVVAIKPGPVVTLFEYEPDMDTKLSKITALEDDLALALQAKSIRILAPIPGTSVVGFEVANNERGNVLFARIARTNVFKKTVAQLPLILGTDTTGESKIIDLTAMPHLLVAGSTGSGKSVALNTMLTSLLCSRTPRELRLILIDPKRLEFSLFQDIGHLLFPIISNTKQAAPVLRWVVKEMEERYEKMAHTDARNIFDFNEQSALEERLPFIVVVIDELADLMMTAGKEIEDLITRIAQMARAAGIHMIVATQRPSVDVITGLIKVNFPSRISFRVTSKIDSRTILDTVGAEKLLGCGDMLFLHATASELQRVHGAFVSNREIHAIVQSIRKGWQIDYKDLAAEIASATSQEECEDVLYKEVLSYLDEVDEVSISLLQRKFRIGYNRSARLIDLLESRGLIMPAQGGRTRKVIKQ